MIEGVHCQSIEKLNVNKQHGQIQKNKQTNSMAGYGSPKIVFKEVGGRVAMKLRPM